MQTLTLKLRLHRPTLAKRRLYRELTRRTTALANNLAAAGLPKGLSSRTAAPYLSEYLPAAVTNQVLRDVGAAKKAERFRTLPPNFNNQNLKLAHQDGWWTASFPTHEGRLRVPIAPTKRQAEQLSRLGKDAKQGAAKFYEKRGRWFLALAVSVRETPCVGTRTAGVDVGLKNLAVLSLDGETLFFSGRQAAFMRRRYAQLRRRMGQAKALRAIRGMKDKEARWMRGLDHQISRRIVDWCLARGVGTIRLEDLTGIRLRGQARRRDRARSLQSWSFHRLQQFIGYKARLAGIQVEWVKPQKTSQTCSVCGHVAKNNRHGIHFLCQACGHMAHADSNAAQNISRAISGLAAA